MSCKRRKLASRRKVSPIHVVRTDSFLTNFDHGAGIEFAIPICDELLRKDKTAKNLSVRII